jgi:hypothetical protein
MIQNSWHPTGTQCIDTNKITVTFQTPYCTLYFRVLDNTLLLYKLFYKVNFFCQRRKVLPVPLVPALALEMVCL